MHQKNIQLLREEAQRLLVIEQDLLVKMKSEPGVLGENQVGEIQSFDRSTIDKHIEVLTGEKAKLDGLEMVLAVVGTMKAGKSTTINAIVGTEVLPNRNRPMTALPTLIRHTPGQIEPILKFENHQPINRLIIDMHDFLKEPHAQDLLKKLDRNSDMNELLSLISNKEKFKISYHGAENIFWFLKSLNDLVRLSSTLGLEFPFSSYDEVHEMPIIEVEFAHLREAKNFGGRLTLLDTPGPNESGQPHLRKMLREQLNKASAVLAVLDFTQLKSDADAEIRRELETIAKVSEGRLYTLVNKFDAKDRNGDNKEEVRTFVSETLMKGLIQREVVFPVSSRRAYLANRARYEMAVHGRLPDYQNHPWVEDFAKEAMGKRWEKYIEDDEEIRESADELWVDSLFSEPMDKVIHAAYTRAAVFAVDSAAAKLLDYGSQVENFLGIRETALTKSSKELQQQINALIGDISRVENSEKITQKHINDTILQATHDTEEVFHKIKNNVLQALDKYFKEGKAIEREQAEKRLICENNQNNSEPKSIFTHIMRGFQNRYKISEKIDFNPSNPIIKFDNTDDAIQLIKKIKKSIDGEMKNAEDEMRIAIDFLLKNFEKNFQNEVTLEAKKIIDDMKDRMKDGGFKIHFEAPNVKSLSFNFTSDELMSDAVQEKSKTVKKSRRQSGVWGTVCSWFGTDDWGWETYQTEEKYFQIDITKVKESVNSSIQNAFDGLNKLVSNRVAIPLKTGAAEFFANFKEKVEHIRGDLLQSVRDQERSKVEKDALANRLASLKKAVPEMIKDSRALQSDIKPLLAVD